MKEWRSRRLVVGEGAANFSRAFSFVTLYYLGHGMLSDLSLGEESEVVRVLMGAKISRLRSPT